MSFTAKKYITIKQKCLINIIYNIIEYKAFNFLLSFVEFDLIMSYAEATFNFGNKFKFKNFFGILS